MRSEQSTGEPWGWKVTLHLYGTGECPSTTAIEAASAAAEIVGADDFVGIDTKIIQTKPNEQVAS